MNHIKKIIILFLITTVFSFLSGCGKGEPTSVIKFDEYVLKLHVRNSYVKESLHHDIHPAVSANLLAMYTIHEKYGFNDNILIIRSPNTYTNLDTFVRKNTEDITKPNYYEDKEKDTSLDDCESNIEMIIKKSGLDNEEYPSYFVQSFFLTGNYAYIVSAATDSKENYDQLYRDFKSISCK